MTQMLGKLLTDENRKKTANLLFYIALATELLIMVVEKSELSFSYESYVFRLTFLLTILAVVIMKHDRKELLLLTAALGFGAICYRISGKNDILRIFTFLAAARDIDLKKAMKYSFYFCLSGYIVIALLSVTGIIGDVALITDYGRAAGVETRYVFGFGHPNTLLGCVYSLVLMWIFIYGEKASALVYACMIVTSGIIAVITRSRTGIAMLAFTLVLAVVFRLFPALSKIKLLYILEMLITPLLCIVLTVIAAMASEQAYAGVYFIGSKIFWKYFWKIDAVLNNRIGNLYYGVDNHGGVFTNWKLIAERGSDGYFDLGWARLFYWYGILPTAVIAILIIAIIYVCMVKRDAWSALIVLSLSLYTLIEATFVTRYLGRNFFLLIAGVYLGYFFRNLLFGISDVKENTNV
jgi:hypothetical protein